MSFSGSNQQPPSAAPVQASPVAGTTTANFFERLASDINIAFNKDGAQILTQFSMDFNFTLSADFLNKHPAIKDFLIAIQNLAKSLSPVPAQSSAPAPAPSSAAPARPSICTGCLKSNQQLPSAAPVQASPVAGTTTANFFERLASDIHLAFNKDGAQILAQVSMNFNFTLSADFLNKHPAIKDFLIAIQNLAKSLSPVPAQSSAPASAAPAGAGICNGCPQ